MVATYILYLGLTYNHIRRSIASRTSDPANKTANEKLRRDQESQKKVNRVFMFMSLVYTITILPLIIGFVTIQSVDIAKIGKERHIVLNVTKSSLFLFYICSSVVNPLITILGKPDYKNTLCLMFAKEASKGREETYATNSMELS